MGGTIAVGAPARDVPDYLQEAVARLAGEHRGVSESYSLQTHDGRREALSVGLVLEKDADSTTTRMFAESLSAVVPADGDVQVIALSPSLLTLVGKHCSPVT